MSKYCIQFEVPYWFVILLFPDYLNNLSPDSKEYEDTQGKPAEWALWYEPEL